MGLIFQGDDAVNLQGGVGLICQGGMGLIYHKQSRV